MKTKNLTFILLIVTAAISAANAVPVEVGTGVNSANVYIEWSDGFSADFVINFGQNASDTTTGTDLMLTLNSSLTGFTLLSTDHGTTEQPNVFVDSIEYLGHINGGYDGGENWWHYWIMESDVGQWESPLFGMSGRTITDGDSDGWIYGRAGSPAVPEPATLILLGIGGLILRKRIA